MRVCLAGSQPGWQFGGRARLVLRCDHADAPAHLMRSNEIVHEWDNPLDGLAWMAQHFETPDARWVGFLGYELGRLFEKLPGRARRDVAMPLFAFGHVTAPGDFSPADESAPMAKTAISASTFSREAYLRAVRRCIDYIEAGDVFQINLSQRFELPAGAPADVVWARLLEHAPATYGALLDLGNVQIVSNSPELFLQVSDGKRDRRVITRPIKGTRPRQPGMEATLLRSIKDEAELNMIVDLERNDLGRICKTGTVRVTEPRHIEMHPTVYHGVATVEGTLCDEVDFVQLLRATFPGGSITGAPKIRAMEIIDELEPVARGAYCGAIGYVAADGAMSLNVAIRTMTFADGKVYVPVGGGIVADSDPQAEYDETLVKATAMFDALGVPIAGNGV